MLIPKNTHFNWKFFSKVSNNPFLSDTYIKTFLNNNYD